MPRRFFVLLFLALCAVQCRAAQFTRVQMSLPFDGYITRHTAPMEFDVGTTRVVCNAQTVMVKTDPHHDKKIPFDPALLQPGVAVHVEGDSSDGVAVATRVVVTLGDVAKPQRVSGSGYVMPSSLPNQIWVYGLPLQLDSATHIQDHDGHPVPPEKLPGSWIDFDALRNPGKTVHAVNIVVYPPSVAPDELKFRTQHDPAVIWPDYKNNILGMVVASYGHKLYMVQDEQLQQWIARIGTSLIPQWQKDLPADDPAKIPFRFAVMDHADADVDIRSTPNGLILIPDRVLQNLQNEAQLAALLATAIAKVDERFLYLNRVGLSDAATVGSFLMFGVLGTELLPTNYDHIMMKIDENAGRIALLYTLNAGYDIREAPFAQETGDGASVSNPRQSYTASPAIGTALARDLELYYSCIRYDKLVTHEQEYTAMLALITAADPPKNKH